jgi:predicted phage tail protein
MGHNMGSQHDPLNAGFQGAFEYSYGYQDLSSPSPFRTVMAYNCGSVSCPRILNFSNPQIANPANGRVTGTPMQNNALSINTTAPVVANFRQSTTVVTVPGPPTGLAAQVSGLNVTLSWNAVAADLVWGASAATGYTVQVGSRSGSYDLLSLPVGHTTAISGSAPAGTYYWRVFGTNSAGNGAPSAEAQFTLGGCAPPGAPQNFTHAVGASRVVTLSWATPVTGAAPFSYIVDVGSAPGLTNMLSAPVGGSTSLAVAAPPGTYYVRVRAANACAATSPASNERMIVVP